MIFMCVVNYFSKYKQGSPNFWLEVIISYHISYSWQYSVTNYELLKSMYNVSITLFTNWKKKLICISKFIYNQNRPTTNSFSKTVPKKSLKHNPPICIEIQHSDLNIIKVRKYWANTEPLVFFNIMKFTTKPLNFLALILNSDLLFQFKLLSFSCFD